MRYRIFYTATDGTLASAGPYDTLHEAEVAAYGLGAAGARGIQIVRDHSDFTG